MSGKFEPEQKVHLESFATGLQVAKAVRLGTTTVSSASSQGFPGRRDATSRRTSGAFAASAEQAAALLSVGFDLGTPDSAAPAKEEEEEEDGAPWHDPARALSDRMQLAERRPLFRQLWRPWVSRISDNADTIVRTISTPSSFEKNRGRIPARPFARRPPAPSKHCARN
jgi:hypothetical protein